MTLVETWVRCRSCGGSTPLPEDLTTPTFACSFCRASLVTAEHAGVAATSTDAMLGHLREVASGGDAEGRSAPRLELGSSESREAPCVGCGASVAVPLALSARHVTCRACGKTAPVAAYVSDVERLKLEAARVLAGNAALARLEAEGVACTSCGGANEVPTNGAVQLDCRYCGATILLGGHVDATAVARRRLVLGARGHAGGFPAAERARNRTILTIVALTVLVLLGAFALAVSLRSGR